MAGPAVPWADGSDVVHIVPNSRNLPAEFSETRYPIIVEKLGLCMDSGGAGYRRGGCGYDKRMRTLKDARLLTNADRSMLSCVGVNGGMASNSNRVYIEQSDGDAVAVPGMSDTLRVTANDIICVNTTGGGGWGDPLPAGASSCLLRRGMRYRVPGSCKGGVRRRTQTNWQIL